MGGPIFFKNSFTKRVTRRLQNGSSFPDPICKSTKKNKKTLDSVLNIKREIPKKTSAAHILFSLYFGQIALDLQNSCPYPL